jgi:hypothetical protein
MSHVRMPHTHRGGTGEMPGEETGETPGGRVYVYACLTGEAPGEGPALSGSSKQCSQQRRKQRSNTMGGFSGDFQPRLRVFPFTFFFSGDFQQRLRHAHRRRGALLC